jgi:hypothetical protein
MTRQLPEAASSPVERASLLEADHVRLSRGLERVRRVIADMERLDSLTPDAAAALEKYRENEIRLRQERAKIELQTGKLLSEEPEAALEWDRLEWDRMHGVGPDRVDAAVGRAPAPVQ